MRHTGPDRDGDGQEQFRLLGAAWEETSRHWQDEVARRFERDHWTPLARQSRDYLEALAAMMDLLETAEHDTEFLTARGFYGTATVGSTSWATHTTGSASARTRSCQTARSA